MNRAEEQHDKHENTTKILIADDHSSVRGGLIGVINQESDLGVCAEAETANQALEAINQRRFDLAIVDVSPANTKGSELAERIRLGCPNLPLLTVSMDDRFVCTKRGYQEGTKSCVISREVAKQIITAIRYVQSLLKSSVSGFTVSVKAKRSAGNSGERSQRSKV